MDKKQALIETAFSLFYRNGIHAVGINEILQTAGIAKKTLYKHFASKENLVEAVLDYRDGKFVGWLEQRLQQAESGEARILALFDALDDWINNRVEALDKFNGCFFINTCAEYGDMTSPPHRLSKQHKDRVRSIVGDAVSAIDIGARQQSELIDAVMLLKEGAIVLAQVQGDEQSALKAKRQLTRLMQFS
jgi:AcrR family transcriptional regulator